MGLELEYIFHPHSVAVAGASSDPTKQGHSFFKLLLEYQFPGPVYPVNTHAEEVLGITAYPSLAAIPGTVDYVISSIPADGVLQLIEESAQKGVKVIHLFTARFAETGHQEGAALEREVLKRAQARGIRLIGPNCMGIYHPKGRLSFKANFPQEPGPVAFLSQSGGNAAELVSSTEPRGLRFSKVISYGNATDLNEADFMEYLADDPETEVIGGYVEGVKEGRRFFQALKRAVGRKPVVLLKGGRTGAGTRAVASHTASLAGSREVWQAMCSQAGAVSVSSMEELADLLVAFRFFRPASGFQVGVAGGGGGRSVQSADECEEAGLRAIPFPPDLRERLRARDPLYWDWVSNPADISILGGSPLTLEEILALMAQHPAFDVLIGNVGEHFSLDRPDRSGQVRETASSLIRVGGLTAKPMAVVIGDDLTRWAWQRELMAELRESCVQAGLAVFPTVGRAARALRRFVDYHRRLAESGGG